MLKRGVLKVGTCQFPIGSDVRRNGEHIRRLICRAGQGDANIAHFPECALTGHPGAKEYAWHGYDWPSIVDETRAVMRAARESRIWVALGSIHRLSGKRHPHNCIYLIDNRGRIANRYDKRICTSGELRWFLPGWRPMIADINGVRCGFIICYEKWFPELFREYKRLGVQCVFDSVHSPERDFSPRTNKQCLNDAERSLWIAHARLNHVWISSANHSLPTQDNTSFFVNPDGRLNRLPFKKMGVMINTIDTSHRFWDPSGPFRTLVLKGKFHNGRVFRDSRRRGSIL